MNLSTSIRIVNIYIIIIKNKNSKCETGTMIVRIILPNVVIYGRDGNSDVKFVVMITIV